MRMISSEIKYLDNGISIHFDLCALTSYNYNLETGISISTNTTKRTMKEDNFYHLTSKA